MRKLNEMSKQDEIEYFEDLVKKFSSTDTYLKSLFSPEMLSWVSGQIRNDFGCSPIETFNWYAAQITLAEERLNKANDTIKGIEYQNDFEIGNLIAGLNDLVNELIELKKELQYKNAKIRELKELDNAGAVAIANCYPI